MKNFSIIIISFLILLTIVLNYFLSCSTIKAYQLDIDFKKNIEVISNLDTPPAINARHAVVIDRLSNNILYGKKENEKCKMASTTKIMTALIVIETSSLDGIVTVSKSAANIGGSRLGLSTNDKISVHDLLYGLLLCSGNDAAIALSEYVARFCSKFYQFNEPKSY